MRSKIDFALFKITPEGVISTVAGNGTRGFSGEGGPALDAQLRSPKDLTVDWQGSLFIVDDMPSRIFKLTSEGIIRAITANIANSSEFGSGYANPEQISCPGGLAVDRGGNIYSSDFCHVTVRKITPVGEISTIAGVPSTPERSRAGFSGDGEPATEAEFCSPKSLAIDSAGNLFITDEGNHRIHTLTLGN